MTRGIIVLVPGTEGAANQSFAGLKPLLDRDYEVRLFDFHSDGKRQPEDHFRGYVNQLCDLIQGLDDRPIHLFGYSLGAHVALNAAALESNVESLALVGGWLRTDAFQRERHELWLSLYAEDPALAGRLSLLLQYSPVYRSFLAQQQTAASLVPNRPNEEIRQRIRVNTILDSTEAASKIDIPTLIISGTNDLKVPIGHGLELYGAVKNSTFVKSSGGHALLRERLGEIYGTYEDFLQGATSPGEVVSTLVP